MGTALCVRCSRCLEGIQIGIYAGGDSVSHAAEGGQTLRFGAGRGARVGEAPVFLPAGAREEGTLFGRVVADGDHQVHWGQRVELAQALCPVPRAFTDVYAQLRHRPHRQGMYAAGVGAGAEHREPLAAARSQQSFRHLRAR